MLVPACKQCRREREKLFLKGDRCIGQKCAVTRKPYVPGFLGPKANTRISDYGKQLREKQKARRYYQIGEKQFSNYYTASSKKEGNTSEILWQTLELRLDNIIRKLVSGISVRSARQLVSHGWTLVNGKKVSIPSYILKTGDEITVSQKNLKLAVKQSLPKWLTADTKMEKIKVSAIPDMKDVEVPFNINLVIEYYSK